MEHSQNGRWNVLSKKNKKIKKKNKKVNYQKQLLGRKYNKYIIRHLYSGPLV